MEKKADQEMFTQIRKVCKMAGLLPMRGFNYFSNRHNSRITKKALIFLELGQSQQVWKDILELS